MKRNPNFISLPKHVKSGSENSTPQIHLFPLVVVVAELTAWPGLGKSDRKLRFLFGGKSNSESKPKNRTIRYDMVYSSGQPVRGVRHVLGLALTYFGIFGRPFAGWWFGFGQVTFDRVGVFWVEWEFWRFSEDDWGYGYSNSYKFYYLKMDSLSREILAIYWSR